MVELLPQFDLKDSRTMPKNVVVITTNYNDYDFLSNVSGYQNIQTHIFTDRELKNTNPSVVVHVEKEKNWKYIKRNALCYFPDCDYVVYHDCNVKINMHPFDIIKNIRLENLSTCLDRFTCMYQCEDNELLKLHKVPIGLITYNPMFYIMKNSNVMKEFCKIWERYKSFNLTTYLTQIEPLVLASENVLKISEHKKVKVPVTWGCI